MEGPGRLRPSMVRVLTKASWSISPGAPISPGLLRTHSWHLSGTTGSWTGSARTSFAVEVAQVMLHAGDQQDTIGDLLQGEKWAGKDTVLKLILAAFEV